MGEVETRSSRTTNARAPSSFEVPVHKLNSTLSVQDREILVEVSVERREVPISIISAGHPLRTRSYDIGSCAPINSNRVSRIQVSCTRQVVCTPFHEPRSGMSTTNHRRARGDVEHTRSGRRRPLNDRVRHLDGTHRSKNFRQAAQRRNWQGVRVLVHLAVRFRDIVRGRLARQAPAYMKREDTTRCKLGSALGRWEAPGRELSRPADDNFWLPAAGTRARERRRAHGDAGVPEELP